ncbi:GIY-YIG nuclease family protein [Granulicella sp. WH15]|uniref:GIY-YIG nuclease family protein n=1 Tax=Granulicella sp. WH15 TaxID=2602070 RepID=UPI001366C155|nr:GIY-YIG nuclease family protein [Granulicella sp. WH15]QHN03488.1 GIY-YIG nuclease family protein [Granulicella sp. WH15]
MSDIDLDELRSELSDFAEPEKKGGRSPREERIIAGFEEIQRFVEKHERTPQHGEDRDIFERIYAVRLDRLRSLEEGRSLLAPLDHQGLLSSQQTVATATSLTVDDDELLAELQVASGGINITELRHVRKSVDKRAAEEIANRIVCEDFETFKPLFERVQRELASGARQAIPVQSMDEFRLTEIKQGQFFIVGGQVAYVADVGENFKTQYDRRDSRLRVIYDNGTESNLLIRSFQRSLYPDKDKAGRLITNPEVGPLFANEPEADDLASGTIYVLRSKSEHPVVAANRSVLHKIGVTGGKVETRIANASLDPTFLMADVDVIATYELYNVNRIRLENLIHRVFDPAQLDIEIRDRFGNPVKPREWFLAPLFIVNEVVERIKNGTITQYIYDPATASLVKTT